MANLKKSFINFFFKIFIVEFLLVCLCTFFIYESRPVSEKEIQKVKIKVEDVKYIRIIRENRFIVISNSIEYQFNELGVFVEYSNRELFENIKIGDELELSYVTRYKKYNRVVAAYSKNEVYRSFESYNSQKIPIGITIIIFSILQLIFIFFIVIHIKFNRKNFIQRRRH